MELSKPDISAHKLHIECIKLFGLGYVNWDPETVAMELRKVEPDIPEINLEKIQALSTLISTDLYYYYWETFNAITKAFNNCIPLFDAHCPLEPFEICWSIIEANMVDPDHPVFSKEVEEYIRICFKYHGCNFTPTCVQHILPNYGDKFDKELNDEINAFIEHKKKKKIVDK